MKNASLAAVLLALQLIIVGCDHLRAKDASAEQQAKEQKAAPTSSSTMPTSDRYGANAGPAQ
jgi:hypothetical protein